MPTNKPGYMSKYYNSHKEAFNNPKEKEKRRKRNKARRTMEKAGKAHKFDKKDVDHKKSLKSGGSNDRSNLRMVSRSKNRARKK